MMNTRFSTKTIIEVETLSTPQLKEYLKEAALWNTYNANQQYNSKLYKLLSEITNTYPTATMQQLVENIFIESSNRLSKNILAKQSYN